MRHPADPQTMSGIDSQAEGAVTSGWRSVLFLVGLVAFLGSLLAYAADLLTGHDILRSVLMNAAAALGLVGWAAHDTLTDPESAVDSLSGAASTALILYGLYLVLASVVVAATTPWHGTLSAALAAAGLGLAGILVGFLGFPRESLLEGEENSPETVDTETDDTLESSTDRPRE